jgi:uncharacterized protein
VLIVDTGPLVSIADRGDPHHQACLDLLETDPGPLVTSGLVIAEAGYLLDRNLGPNAEVALVDMIIDGTLTVDTLAAADWVRIGDLCATYSNLPLGVTDASVIALAERHNTNRVATLDRRHFHIVRPTIGPFTIVP